MLNPDELIGQKISWNEESKNKYTKASTLHV